MRLGFSVTICCVIKTFSQQIINKPRHRTATSPASVSPWTPRLWPLMMWTLVFFLNYLRLCTKNTFSKLSDSPEVMCDMCNSYKSCVCASSSSSSSGANYQCVDPNSSLRDVTDVSLVSEKKFEPPQCLQNDVANSAPSNLTDSHDKRSGGSCRTSTDHLFSRAQPN